MLANAIPYLFMLLLAVGPARDVADKSISYSGQEYFANYGRNLLITYRVGCADINGDGIVGPGDTFDHGWQTRVYVEQEELGWFTIMEGQLPAPEDPGTTVSHLRLEHPADLDGRAETRILGWLRSIELEVDRSYNFDVWNYHECWVNCLAEHVPMKLHVRPRVVPDLVVAPDTIDPTANLLQWSPVVTDTLVVGSYSIHRGRGIEIDAQNTAMGELVVADLAPGVLSYADQPPTDDFGYIYTVFGHDESGKIIARSDQVAPVGALAGVYNGAVDWGDYDGDGALDILLTGYHDEDEFVSAVYRNEGGTFAALEDTILGAYLAAAAWNDFDADGDLDFLLAGQTVVSGTRTYLYRNDEGVFANSEAGIPALMNCAVDWGDFDRDGDQDLLLAGWQYGSRIARIYRNDEGVFTDVQAGLAGAIRCDVAWADYDTDGDLDLLVSGSDAGDNEHTALYKNDGGVFTLAASGLPRVARSAVAWGDYDADGDPDLALAGGDTDTTSICGVFRNDGGTFVDIGAGLPGVEFGDLAWGDYDNDGDLDLLLTGGAADGPTAGVYRNDGGAFALDPDYALIAVGRSDVAWGDADGDGDLDVLVTGETAAGNHALVAKNDLDKPNTPPTAPANLTATFGAGTITFSWSAATDAETPAAGLTYNLRVGTAPDDGSVCPAMADPATGRRFVVEPGNVGACLSVTLQVEPGAYFWSVQAIDGAYAGSAFAPAKHVSMVSATPDVRPATGRTELHPAVPNPFNPQTTVAFSVAERTSVSLRIYDIHGRLVRTLVDGRIHEQGRHELIWSGDDERGRGVAAGVYFVRLTAGGTTDTERVVVVK